MKNRIITLFVAFVLIASWISACTMSPAVWKMIEQIDYDHEPGTYALVEAFMQMRIKFEKELRACKLPYKPVIVIGAWHGTESETISSSTYNNLHHAMEVVWNDSKILQRELFPKNMTDFGAQVEIAGLSPDNYIITLLITDSKTSSINMIDLNDRLYGLLRLVYREELKMFVRITDSSGIPVFLDEFEVSPTFVADPLLSPLGGFFVRFEKNTSMPMAIDFGTVQDGGEHILRVNTAFHQPSEVPPLSEFVSELQKSIEVDSVVNEVGYAHDHKHEDKSTFNVANALKVAILSLDYELFKKNMKNDFNANIYDSDGMALLHFACKVSAVEMVEALLKKGADVSYKSNDGKNALMHSVDISALCLTKTPQKEGVLNICPITIPELLIKAGADVNATDNNGDSALHIASKNSLTGMIGVLINSGANLNQKNNEGKTPLHLADGAMTVACAQVLLTMGADPDIKDNKGQTPLDVAIKKVNAPLVNAINDYKRTKK